MLYDSHGNLVDTDSSKRTKHQISAQQQPESIPLAGIKNGHTNHEADERETTSSADTPDPQLKIQQRLMWANIVLAISSIVGIFLTISQLHLTNQALRSNTDSALQTLQQMKEQSAAAKISADAARDAARTAAKSLEISDRAYLSAGDPSDEGGYGLLRFPVRNSGRAVAKNVTLKFHFGRFDISPRGNTLIDRRVSTIKLASALPPSDAPLNFILVFAPIYATSDRVAIRQGRQTLNARGTISYDSGFGQNDSATFCYIFQGMRNRWENCGGNRSIWLDTIRNSYKEVKH
jgi:hypothetical protein